MSDIVLTGSPLHLDLAANAEGAHKFSLNAYTGNQMKLEGFAYPVVVDLKTLKPLRDKLPLLRAHDPERAIGHAEAGKVKGGGLELSGHVYGHNDDGREVIELYGRGFPWALSIGASLDNRPEFVAAGSEVKANGRTFTGPLLLARGALIREVSVLPLGADPDTSMTLAAGWELDLECDADDTGYIAAEYEEPEEEDPPLYDCTFPERDHDRVEAALRRAGVSWYADGRGDVGRIIVEGVNPIVDLGISVPDLTARELDDDEAEHVIESGDFYITPLGTVRVP